MIRSLSSTLGKWSRKTDLALALVVVCIIVLLIIPLKPFILDILISLSIVLSVTTLLVTLYTEEPLSFSSFPSLLLFMTLFRLGLNIATTRMILTNGYAGQIIQTFGGVVSGGSHVIGFVLFILLTGINFVVITKGSGRVAEVAARFTLDSLPGKQASIDAELSSGIIDQGQAKYRRQKVIAEADFYGSMDGASKFVRGDAIAGIVITLVNIIGGLLVGGLVRHLPLHDILDIYITLTIGDGLVTQIPALLISVGAGILVTRSSSKQNLGILFRQQLFNNPKVLFVTATVLFLLGLMPGMPLLVMAPISFAMGLYGYYLSQLEIQAKRTSEAQGIVQFDDKEDEIKETRKQLAAMSIKLGRNLSYLADAHAKDKKNLFLSISRVRKEILSEVGLSVPSISVIQDSDLSKDQFSILIKKIPVFEGTIPNGMVLAVDETALPSIHANPESPLPQNYPCRWIHRHEKEQARIKGETLHYPLNIIGSQLKEVIISHAHELLNRQDVAKLVEQTRLHATAVVDELIPQRLSIGQLLRILKNLLRERVSIVDFTFIMEILADHTHITSDPDLLTEYVRQGLSREITQEWIDDDRTLHVITIDPNLESQLKKSLVKDDFGMRLSVHPSFSLDFIERIERILVLHEKSAFKPILLTTATLRPHVKKMIIRAYPTLPVLSHDEILPEMIVQTIGMIGQDLATRNQPSEALL